MYHFILIEELQHHRWWAFVDGLDRPKDLDVIDDDSLIPGGAHCFLHLTREGGVSTERDDGIGVRQATPVTAVHVPGLVQVHSQLVGVALCRNACMIISGNTTLT